MELTNPNRRERKNEDHSEPGGRAGPGPRTGPGDGDELATSVSRSAVLSDVILACRPLKDAGDLWTWMRRSASGSARCGTA
ncbi:hypothetical protein BIW11_05350 [Tropilaelaps mercedesae]|uniref:Uncharacterized protein n=1 Tax=Tropilaelaps mercedesae TaxID=418985 RepID=A0A1V9Y345_9ACAR|nr:hypothetical protein BIW11_05350 [Tropilaelaps mercedesae]